MSSKVLKKTHTLKINNIQNCEKKNPQIPNKNKYTEFKDLNVEFPEDVESNYV